MLGRVPSELAPGQVLALMRVTIAPGASVAPHSHPSETIVHLSLGTLHFTLHEGKAQLVRGVDGAPAAATQTAMEPIPVGEEIMLSAGNTIFYDAAAVQSERNNGEEDVMPFLTNLRDVDEPARQSHDEMAVSMPTA